MNLGRRRVPRSEKVPRGSSRTLAVESPVAGGSFVPVGLVVLKFLLWRNGHIKNVVLFEENSILPLPERSEACWQFLVSDLLFGSWEYNTKTSLQENLTPEASEHLGGRRIEFASTSSTF